MQQAEQTQKEVWGKALHDAIQENRLDRVQELVGRIKREAPTLLKDILGYIEPYQQGRKSDDYCHRENNSPLCHALSAERLDIALLLLREGADPSWKNSYGVDALDMLSMVGFSKEKLEESKETTPDRLKKIEKALSLMNERQKGWFLKRLNDKTTCSPYTGGQVSLLAVVLHHSPNEELIKIWEKYGAQVKYTCPMWELLMETESTFGRMFLKQKFKQELSDPGNLYQVGILWSPTQGRNAVQAAAVQTFRINADTDIRRKEAWENLKVYQQILGEENFKETLNAAGPRPVLHEFLDEYGSGMLDDKKEREGKEILERLASMGADIRAKVSGKNLVERIEARVEEVLKTPKNEKEISQLGRLLDCVLDLESRVGLGVTSHHKMR